MRISHTTPEGEQAFPHEIPQFGLGVFLMSDDGEYDCYNNEHEVGAALKESTCLGTPSLVSASVSNVST